MTAVVVLFSLAAALAAFGGGVTGVTTWGVRAPRLALLMWQALTLTILSSLVLALSLVALPLAPAVPSLAAGWLGTCLGLLEEHYAVPVSRREAGAACLILLALGIRTVVSVVLQARRSRIARAHARSKMRLVARPEGDRLTLVIDDPAPMAFCIPGHRPSIVITSGAIGVLSPLERAAVMAHEHAHLRHRHHWLIVWTLGLHSALPFVPAFRQALREVPLLVELHADDVAARGHDRRTLASALVQMASGTSPVASLSLNGADVAARVQRLVGHQRRIARSLQVLWAVSAAVLVSAPIAVALMPALESILQMACAPFEHACDVPGSSDVALDSPL